MNNEPYRVMKPQFESAALDCYESRFFSYGLFGLLDEWVRRGFLETPQEMIQIFHTVMSERGEN